MSYDIRLVNPDGTTFEFSTPLDIKGGTYAVGGTTEACINVTYNYSKHFFRVFGEKGIRSLYGVSSRDSTDIIVAAMMQLDNDVHPDYWEDTEGNAKKALADMLLMAIFANFDCKWEGD